MEIFYVFERRPWEQNQIIYIIRDDSKFDESYLIVAQYVIFSKTFEIFRLGQIYLSLVTRFYKLVMLCF